MLVEEAVGDVDAFDTFVHVMDSRNACETIVSDRPGAVLLDLRMPGLSGWEVLEQLRVRGALDATYVAILSNSSSASDQAAALERGAKAYFVKPFEPDGYVDILKQVAGMMAGAG